MFVLYKIVFNVVELISATNAQMVTIWSHPNKAVLNVLMNARFVRANKFVKAVKTYFIYKIQCAWFVQQIVRLAIWTEHVHLAKMELTIFN